MVSDQLLELLDIVRVAHRRTAAATPSALLVLVVFGVVGVGDSARVDTGGRAIDLALTRDVDAPLHAACLDSGLLGEGLELCSEGGLPCSDVGHDPCERILV